MDRYNRPAHRIPARRRRLPLGLEALELRRLLATFVVSNTADEGEGSLRQAILDANGNPGADRIVFNIPQEDPGFIPASGNSPASWSIRPLSALPDIQRNVETPGVPNPVDLDATTQPGYAGGPVVEINGVSAGGGVNGLTITAGGSRVAGLAINQFQPQGAGDQSVGGHGIRLAVNGGNVIQANYLGPDVSASRRVGNGRSGLFIDNSPNNTVGGTVPGEGNVLASNQTDGLFIQGGAASGNIVQGNVIGTNSSFDPNVDLANFIDGVEINGAPGNLIGGEAPGAGNVIAHNNGNGVSIRRAGATGNVVQGNFIGTDPIGGNRIGNLLDGVFISGASNNLIGGPSLAARNVIGRNRIGVDIQPMALGATGTSDATGNVVQGNLIGIGLDPGGTPLRLDNLTDGVNLGGSRNLIGGPGAGAGNVISRNGANGVQIAGRTFFGAGFLGTGNTVQGNRIGTDPTGAVAFPNAQDGVTINRSGLNAIVENQVAGNATAGISVLGLESSGNLVRGNRVGTDASGARALGNGTDGLVLSGGAASNLVGGPGDEGRNIFSGNGVSGVRFAGAANNNTVWNNLIGLDASGATALGNGVYGVLIADGAAANVIGAAAAGLGNVISSNRIGVAITGTATTGNVLQGNDVGLLAAESQQTGVLVENAPGNVVGGEAAGAGNRIVRNTGPGVQVSGAGSTGTLVQGNRVVANGGNGVMIINAGGNLVGGPRAEAGNRIAGNGGAGVAILGADASGNGIQANAIGTADDDASAAGNVSFGVLIQDAPGTLVGGDQTGGEGNAIGGNRTGVEVQGAGSVGTVIQGNFIGTSRSGAALGNLNDGIELVEVVGSLVGGAATAARNVISGNVLDGVRVVRGSGARIVGNTVGAAPSGTAALPNREYGIHVDGASATEVGGDGQGDGNLISGNGVAGVRVDAVGAVAPQIVGNRIGTDVSGRRAVANQAGVQLIDVGSVMIRSNQISGNVSLGVQVVGGSSSGNQVRDNLIGLAADGSSPLPNDVGVLFDGAPRNLVGPGNVISGNATVGVQFFGQAATGNSVFGNTIGPGSGGEGLVEVPGAGTDQARLQDIGVLMNDAPGNLIGGADAGAGNVLSGNFVGVEVAGVNAGGSGQGANRILGNLIGTDRTGARPLGNVVGVYVNGVPGVQVGGATTGEGNVISGNTSIGVSLFGTQTRDVDIEGNIIGPASDGRTPFFLRGRQFVQPVGVYLEDTSTNRIGGDSATTGNVLSGNDVAGVYIFGQANLSRSNVVQNNLIGLTADGGRIGNRSYGVLLFNSANNTVVRKGRNRNRFARNGIADFREFTGPVPRGPARAATARIRGVTRALNRP